LKTKLLQIQLLYFLNFVVRWMERLKKKKVGQEVMEPFKEKKFFLNVNWL